MKYFLFIFLLFVLPATGFAQKFSDVPADHVQGGTFEDEFSLEFSNLRGSILRALK